MKKLCTHKIMYSSKQGSALLIVLCASILFSTVLLSFWRHMTLCHDTLVTREIHWNSVLHVLKHLRQEAGYVALHFAMIKKQVMHESVRKIIQEKKDSQFEALLKNNEKGVVVEVVFYKGAEKNVHLACLVAQDTENAHQTRITGFTFCDAL